MFPRPLCVYPSDEDLQTFGKLGHCIAKGGASDVHADPQRRTADLEENNEDHAIGDLAVALYLRGPQGATEAAMSLAARIDSAGTHLRPIPSLAVNCKASKWRTKKGLAGHRLPVRPKSREQGMLYILCIVPPPQFRFVILPGYATDEMLLPSNIVQRKDDPFFGAHALYMHELQPLMPLRWTVRDQRVRHSRQNDLWAERELIQPCTDELIEEIEESIGVAPAERWKVQQAKYTMPALPTAPTAKNMTAVILSAGVNVGGTP